MQTWVIKAQQGDPEAFRKLVRHFSGMAHAVSYQKLGDFYLAQDAVQEAFAEAYLKLGTLEHTETFPGWFRVIVERKCYRFSSIIFTDTLCVRSVNIWKLLQRY